MKKILMFLVGILFVGTVSAYVPMLEEGNRWNELNILYKGDFYDNMTNIVKVDGFKDVDSVRYYQTKRSGGDTTVFDNFILMREDTAEQKVYAMLDEEEYLIYDFDVEVGDTVLAYVSFVEEDYSKLCVKSISALHDLAGNECRVVKLGNDSSPHICMEEIVWIEGYGSTRGLVYTSYGAVGGATQHLQCAYKGGELTYESGWADEYNCYIWDVHTNTEIQEEKAGDIYYDARNEEMRMEVGGDAKVYIYDMQGRLVQEGSVTPQDNGFEVYVEKGIYVVTLMEEGGRRITEKVVL